MCPACSPSIRSAAMCAASRTTLLRGQEPSRYLDGACRHRASARRWIWCRHLFALERIEVLRGPSSVLDGGFSPERTNRRSHSSACRPRRIVITASQYGVSTSKAVGDGLHWELTKDGELLYRSSACCAMRTAYRLRAERPQPAGAIPNLASDERHLVDRARQLPEGQLRRAQRSPSRSKARLKPGRRAHPGQPLRRREEFRSLQHHDRKGHEPR